MAIVYNEAALAKAVAVLGKHTSVESAVAELGCSYGGLKSAMRKAGMNPPSAYLARNVGLQGSSRTRVLVIPDMHIPYHDKGVWDIMLAAVRKLQPDHVVVIGDFIDCFEISDFPKPADRKTRFEDEIAAANEELHRLDAAHRGKPTTYCMGNHEHRFDRYLAKRAPELSGLISIEDLLGLRGRGYEVVPYGEDTQIGKIHFSHEFGPMGKYAGHKTLAAMGHCCVFGHIHTAQVVYDGFTTGERHVAMAVGWGGDYESLAFAYKRKAAAKKEWIHGFGWVEIDDTTGNGWVQFVPIIDGQAVVAGQEVRA